MFGVCEGRKDPDRLRTIKFRAGVGVIKSLLLSLHDMPPKSQDEITALCLQQAEAQVALARATVEKLEAEWVAKEAALRKAEAAEQEAERARQPKKRTPMKKAGGTAAGEERTEKVTE